MTRRADAFHALIPRAPDFGRLDQSLWTLARERWCKRSFDSRHGNVPTTLVIAVAICAGNSPPALPLLMIKSTLSIK